MTSTFRRFVLAFVVIIAMAGASSAYADSLNYQLTGPGTGGSYSASFTLSGKPTPSGGSPILFWFNSLPVDVNGQWKNFTVGFSLLGAGILGSNALALGGPQLFSWSSSGLTMNTGTFNLLLWNGSSWGKYTLSVTRVTTSVPESSALVLLMAGLVILFAFRLYRPSHRTT